MVRHANSRGGGAYGFSTPPQQQARDQFAYDKTLGHLTQDANARQTMYAEYLQAKQKAIASGAAESTIPFIGPTHSAKDMSAAIARINQTIGVKPGSTPATTATPAAKFTGFTPVTSALSLGASAGGGKVPIATPRPAPSAPASTSRASTVPAIGANGEQMRNLDNSPRTLQRILPIAESNKAAFGPDFYNISHEEQRGRLALAPRSPNVGTTTSTGASGFNFGGERNVQTVGTMGETAKEYDPTHDLTKSPLAAGDSMLPKGATGGVMIDPKYRTPGADAFGFTTRGPAVPGQSDPEPFTAAPGPKAPTSPGITAPATPPSSSFPIFGPSINTPTPTAPSAVAFKMANPNVPTAGAVGGLDRLGPKQGTSNVAQTSPAPVAAQAGANKIADRAEAGTAGAPTPYPGVDKDYSGSGGSFAPFDYSHPASTIGGASGGAASTVAHTAGLIPKPPMFDEEAERRRKLAQNGMDVGGMNAAFNF